MDVDAALDFVREHHEAVLLTYRGDGSPQLSPITCNVDAQGAVVVSTRETALKVRNLRRDPRASLCVLSQGFYGEWIQIDGTVEIVSLPEAMEPLVDYYRSLQGEHPDWDDYRAAMVRDQRVVLRITVARGPGSFRLTVAVAVFAAGRGSRLGGDASKPLLEWRGRPLLAWSLDAALGSGLAPVLVTVGYRADDVRAAIPAGVEVVENGAWEEGIAASLRAVLEVLGPRGDVSALCVGLADQPRTGAAAYRRLADAHVAGAALAVATYGGRRGNPVLLSRSLWSEALELRGDAGARQLMSNRPVTSPVVEVPCDGTGDSDDVDTLEDLGRLQEEQ